MPVDAGSRVIHLGSLLENKNRGIRTEAAASFANFLPSDEKTRQVILSHLVSNSWETRVATADALLAMLQALPCADLPVKEVSTPPSADLIQMNLTDLIGKYKPLLSAGSNQIDEGGKTLLNSKQQRKLIDQHLDLTANTGLSSNAFLDDSEVFCTASSSSSPKQYDQGNELAAEVKKEEITEVQSTNGNSETDPDAASVELLTRRQIANLADPRWQYRHGAALALTKILSCFWNRLPSPLRDTCALRLLQVLALDHFNDFVSGRSATAPVRESAAQALAHYIFRSGPERQDVVLEHWKTLLQMKDEKLWICRQSALLVMKYYFAIANFGVKFTEFFALVVDLLHDPVDDVVSAAVTALSSLFANETMHAEKKAFISTVMEAVWTLLMVESKKEQLRSGLDALAVDLMGIVETWLAEEENSESITVAPHQFAVIIDLIDAQFQSRTRTCVRLISVILDRKPPELSDQEVFVVLKTFYRCLLFSPPADSTQMLEELYLTSLKVINIYRKSFTTSPFMRDTVGLWVGCLMLDHKNPLIDVFSHCVECENSTENEPLERMCSEEMRFLVDREKDDVYITRKILAAKLLAVLLQSLYESGMQVDGQPISTALQLLLCPFLKSNSLYQNLGAAIVANEWAILYKASVTRGVVVDAPYTILGVMDTVLRSGGKQFDELSSSVLQLTADCNEFVDYCCLRGAKRDSLCLDEATSVEEIARKAYEQCKLVTNGAKSLESLESRYKVLSDWMEFTKVAIRSNSNRVMSFLASSLLNFGYVGEKMTPLVRPLIDTMTTEENATVAAEVFKGAVPPLIVFSWQRNPRPYVKVIAKTLEIFRSCNKRIPDAVEGPSASKILSLQLDEEPSFSSKNAEFLLHVCCNFNIDQLPEFYSYFELDSDIDDEAFITRLELHRCMWFRVGSRFSDKAAERVLHMLGSANPVERLVAARAVATFTSSSLADTMNRVYDRLCEMLQDLSSPDKRRGAAEVLLRLSQLGSSLTGVVSLLAPIIFPRLADSLADVREAAGTAFRNLVPLLTLEKIPESIPAGLVDSIHSKCMTNATFISVLSQPSSLPSVQQEEIKGLADGVKLRHYQLEGITWMRFMRKFGLNGILADDMGLGKTLQTLTVLAMGIQESEQKLRPSLIVCPRTIVDHWCGEWRRYFPQRKPAVKAEGAVPTRLQTAQIVVTAYEDLKGNRLLHSIAWNYVVLDEGHILRNPKTAVWKAAKELVSQSRLILSGTPVQNSPGDLWALFEWLMPGYLGDDKQFRTQFLRSIHRCRSPKASDKDLQDGQEALGRLHRLVLPFVLRRLKKEVLPELPDKVVQDYECEITEEQRTLYKLIADRCTSDQSRLSQGLGISPLHALIALRKVVDSPKLVADLLPKLDSDTDLTPLVKNGGSGKLAALGELLQQCGIGRDAFGETRDEEVDDALLSIPSAAPHRALIFCQWRASVLLVSEALSNGLTPQPVSHMILDGSIAPSDRQNVVDKFNNDHSIDVLILTTHVGGVGLNLTGADVVIFLDHDWNPMKDLQAIDRAHRLGQTRKVHVYRLITKGTIEEKVMGYQKFKQNTADALIGTDNRSLSSMATDELMNLFTLEGDANAREMAEPKAKRTRMEKMTEGYEDSRWNLTELWDESQYEETSDVRAFAREAKR